MQNARRVRTNVDAGTDLAEHTRLLIDLHVKSSPQQRRSHSKAANAATYDCDRGPTCDGHTACLRLLDQTCFGRSDSFAPLPVHDRRPARAWPRPPNDIESRNQLLCRRFLQRVFNGFEGRELYGPGLAIHLLDFTDIDVLHNVTSARVDRDRSARTFPFHALHGCDYRIGISLPVGLFQRLVDQMHTIIAAHRNEVRTVTGGLCISRNIVLVGL